MSLTADALTHLIPNLADFHGRDLTVFSPGDGRKLAELRVDSRETVDAKIARSVEAFEAWREVPGPRRGELVRLYGE
jgi:aldehyde dehydrogenase (NAD+)